MDSPGLSAGVSYGVSPPDASFFQPAGYLALDLLRIGWIGLERQRLLPGFARLVLVSRPPVRIAEMVSYFAERRFESGRALQQRDRVLVVAEAVMRPTETVEPIAVVRLEFYGLPFGPADIRLGMAGVVQGRTLFSVCFDQRATMRAVSWLLRREQISAVVSSFGLWALYRSC
jgi:hypothetical protein